MGLSETEKNELTIGEATNLELMGKSLVRLREWQAERPSRETALAITKMDEAIMWFERSPSP